MMSCIGMRLKPATQLAFANRQGRKIASGTVIEHLFHSCITLARYATKGPINESIILFVNDGNSPPEYVDMPGIIVNYCVNVRDEATLHSQCKPQRRHRRYREGGQGAQNI